MNFELNSISTKEFWEFHGELNSKTIPLIIIFPSGRAKIASSGHLALISDALYTPEIVSEILSIMKGSEYSLSIRGMLDIDFYDELNQIRNCNLLAQKENPLSIINSNIITIATADINVVSKLLLDESGSIEQYNIGYKRPFEHCIITGGNSKIYTVTACPNVGLLGLYKVPWSVGNRFAIFSGGILASGTLASNLLLSYYLKGEKFGNNTFDPAVPIKIVSSSNRNYENIKLIPDEDCIPQHVLSNITNKLKIFE